MESSYRRASCCSVFFNCYQNNLMRSIKKGAELTPDYLFHMKESDDVGKVLKSLTHQWSKEKQKAKPSLLRALCRSFGCSFLAISLLGVLAN